MQTQMAAMPNRTNDLRVEHFRISSSLDSTIQNRVANHTRRQYSNLIAKIPHIDHVHRPALCNIDRISPAIPIRSIWFWHIRRKLCRPATNYPGTTTTMSDKFSFGLNLPVNRNTNKSITNFIQLSIKMITNK